MSIKIIPINKQLIKFSKQTPVTEQELKKSLEMLENLKNKSTTKNRWCKWIKKHILNYIMTK